VFGGRIEQLIARGIDLDTVTLEVIVILILVVLNGFFSCAEFAIISIRKSRIAQLVAANDELAKIVEDLQKDPHRLLAVVQIGVTVVGSTASAVGGIIAVEHLKPFLMQSSIAWLQNTAEPVSVTLVVALVSYMSLIVGELVPKSIGLRYADPLAFKVAKPIRFLARSTGWGISFLTISSKAVLRLLGIRGEAQAFITREEVQHIVAEGHESGVFSATEQEFIENLFDFTHTSVREVMVPRTRIVGLNLDLPREELVQQLLDNQYSRYPVYRGSIENVIGFIHGKDFLGRMVGDAQFDMDAIIRPPVFVPEVKKVNELLKEMQRRRVHMVLVVDEYGGISGLATTEDLLEELVGEIEDEHDVGEPHQVRRLADGSMVVDALLSLSHLEDLLDIALDDDLPYDTLAGLILDQLGRFPEGGESVIWRGFELRCEEVTPTAIVRVRIRPLPGELPPVE
jgi:putative hemolysin